MTDPAAAARHHAVLALLAEVYTTGLERRDPLMRRWAEEMDAIYALHAESAKERKP